MSNKTKFPAALARRVADNLMEWLRPVCDRIEIAGSLRRGRPEVGDVEILYIPRKGMVRLPGEMFAAEGLLPDGVLNELVGSGKLEKRLNADGHETWGAKIKLARHVASGVPVDFFATEEASWWNYLVCRTGSAENNVAICQAARARGWKWEPYSSGFVSLESDAARHAVGSEREVFEFAGLEYREPNKR